MKKKTNLIYLAAVLVLASCTKNLDQTPQSTASRDAVFSSEDGLKLYTNSFYNILPGITAPYEADGMTDYSARGSVPDFLRPGAYTSRTASGWSWTDLRNINYFLANLPASSLPAATKTNYTGLARFFRAYFYFNKVKQFGNVPFIGKPLDVNDTTILYAARDPRTLVMDSVLADINFACDNMPLADDKTRSQITKWVALGLKSRICLYEGTFRKYQTSYGLQSTAAVWLQNAADAAKKVMDGGAFSLNAGTSTDNAYRQLFNSTAVVSSEIMLADIASSDLAILNDANWWYTSATYGIRLSLTRTFVNTYLNINGTPFTNTSGYQTQTFMQETQGRDKRLAQTIRTPGYKRLVGGVSTAAPPVFSYTYTGYMPIKWTFDNSDYDGGVLNTNPISIMRYGEILLNYAEATAELGTMTDADWTKTIGALRARAGITGGTTTRPTTVDPYMQANYYPDITDPVIMEVRRERGTELVLEGFRLDDLTRWKHGELLLKSWTGFYVPALNTAYDLDLDGKNDVLFYQGTAPSPISGVTFVNVSPTVNGAVNSLQLANGTSGEIHWLDNITRSFQDYQYLYPIPFADLQLNPKLLQNPGWQ